MTVKVVALVQKKPGMDRSAFFQHWHDVHAPYVTALPGLTGYVQNRSLSPDREDTYDGAAELWFPDRAVYRIAFQSEAALSMRSDERNFLGRMTWILAEEEVIYSPMEGKE